ncbi:VTT domain-containing protein [Rhabdochromatium marinum]|uniref:VTT domain-containing protein n=1 Tax=Rhabdochromatium marinum TaxID=48729 RepID=UPI0019030882|nr:VTT domain-containing protein [Rhabdochromatium marinum]MBK1647275.1 hypothetical protein [Rhabdochromatium marinum]
MEAALSAVLDSIRAHPSAAYGVIFAVALAESLAVIGVVVPGVLMMLAAGALIADGVLSFWPSCLLAILGAILGDTLSFWLGRHYQSHLRRLWPFSRHPAPLERGMAFFSRHGAKSILLGRFVGPMRAMVPLVAGMLDMPIRAFFLANLGSALLWGPAYLAPGILFGASLKLASEAATGLLFISLALIAVLFAAVWLSRHLVRWAGYQASAWVSALLHWADLHPLMGRIAAALADPRHPDAGTLTGLALALLAATLILGLSLSLVLLGPDSLSLNRMVLDLGQSLSSPEADHILGMLNTLGDPALLLPLVALVFVSLRWQARQRDAAYWLAAASFALIASPLLGALIGTARPTPHVELTTWPWSFPNPQVLSATLIYGFLALMIARALPVRQRWQPFALASSLVSALSFARLYFGTEWLTDLLASVTLALLWLAALGLAYARHTAPGRGARPLILIALLAWLPGYLMLSLDNNAAQRIHHRPATALTHLTPEQWLSGAPAELPGMRQDLWQQQRQPLDIQYAGALPALSHALAASGWQPATRLNWHNALRLFSHSAPLSSLPLIPHVHQGRHERLTLSRQHADGRRYVLRLWATHDLITGCGPLWIGDITEVTKTSIAGWFAIPVTRPGTPVAELDALARALQSDPSFAQHRTERLRLSHCRAADPPSAASAPAAPASDPAPAPP